MSTPSNTHRPSDARIGTVDSRSGGVDTSTRRVGMAVVGLGGAVATTAVAGLELLRLGAVGIEGLPLADLPAPGLVPYDGLVIGGWDLDESDLAKAASVHGVLDYRQIEVAGPGLSQLKPWPAAGDEEFCRNVSGSNTVGRRAR